MKTLQPKQGRVLLKAVKEKKEEQAKGSFMIPPNPDYKKDMIEGEVITLGTKMGGDYKQTEDETEVGDTVLFVKWAASEVTIGEDTFYIIRYEDIISGVQEV